MYELQFGFRSKHSTNHALLCLTEMIREALDLLLVVFFIDLQKAFNTVDHHILLKKWNIIELRVVQMTGLGPTYLTRNYLSQ